MPGTATLAVGVTGHRRLADPAAAAAAVDAVLDGLAARVGQQPRWVVVSPLADGADRVVVTRVLARAAPGVPRPRLVAVLPLPADDYATDFDADSERAFRELLARADEVVVAGRAGDTREAAYERAGRAVVARCDVLLALWDGRPQRGQGGTAGVVQDARTAGRRVVVVPVERATSDQAPR